MKRALLRVKAHLPKLAGHAARQLDQLGPVIPADTDPQNLGS